VSLVELLASLTLSVILLAVILGVTSRLSHSQEVLRREYPFEVWRNRLELQLNEDFQNCRTIMINGDKSEIAMLTCRSTNADGVTKNHLPSAVVYKISSSEQKSYLVRLERPLVDNPTRKVTKSILCQNIARMVASQNLETDYPPPSLVLKFLHTEGATFSICLARHGGRE
jgi:hypothetical protein